MDVSSASERPATVGITELRRHSSDYLRRVAGGERLIITNRNRPEAELRPVSRPQAGVAQLILEGRAIAPRRPRRRRFDPIEIPGLAPNALSNALRELRDAERS